MARRRGETAGGWMEALEGARRLLRSGEVEEAFERLSAAWSHPAFETAADLLAFARDSLNLAAIYQWTEAGPAWLERAERALDGLDGSPGRDRRRERILLQALRARFQLVHADPEPGRAFFRRFLGRGAAKPVWEPWLLNFHLAILLIDYRLEEVDRIFRSATLPGRLYSPYDAALRLRLLGNLMAQENHDQKTLRILEAAGRKFLEIGTPEAEAQAVHCISYRARLLASSGKIDEAEHSIETAARIAGRLRAPTADEIVLRTRAFLERSQGRPQRAIEINLEGAGPRLLDDRRSKGRKVQLQPPTSWGKANALIFAAKSAVQIGNLDLAGGLLEQAKELLEGSSLPPLFARFHLVRGEWYLSRNSLADRELARREFDAVEAALKGSRSRQSWADCHLLINRGRLAMQEGKVAEAIEFAERCCELAQERNFFHIAAQGLLLQSALLLEGEAPRERLYERILPRLGAIRDAETLFKVIANLYLYTWELRGDLELTDLHLKQLQRIRDRVGDPRFQELYRIHVTAPVLQRLSRRLQGG